MGKRVEHKINVTVDDKGICHGSMVIHHGRIKVGTTVLGTDIKWTCDVEGKEIADLLWDACGQISVDMANVRDAKDAQSVVAKLNGSTVKYDDISKWTKKERQGRKKEEDMNADELSALIARAQKLLDEKKKGLR